MGARLLNSCQMENFDSRQNSLLPLHDIPNHPKNRLVQKYEEDHHKKVAIKNSFKMLKIFLAKNAILEDILRVISRLRLGCNKCQIKCYEHVS